MKPRRRAPKRKKSRAPIKRNRIARPLNDDDAEEWMTGQPSDKAPAKA